MLYFLWSKHPVSTPIILNSLKTSNMDWLNCSSSSLYSDLWESVCISSKFKLFQISRLVAWLAQLLLSLAPSIIYFLISGFWSILRSLRESQALLTATFGFLKVLEHCDLSLFSLTGSLVVHGLNYSSQTLLSLFLSIR